MKKLRILQDQLKQSLMEVSRAELVIYRNFLCRIDELRASGIDVPADVVAAVERNAILLLKGAMWLY
jgi:hypothetical protein